MPNLEDFIGKNFERVLRWVYPGALFIALLYASQPDFLIDDKDALYSYSKIGIWGLLVGGLVAGFVVYLLQSCVVSYIITLFFILIKWDVRQGLQKPAPKIKMKPLYCPICIIRLFNRMARNKYIYRLKRLARPFNQIVEADPVCCPRCIVRLFDRMAEATRERWISSGQKDLQDYLNYAWATYHAVLMTGWLTLVFYFFVAKRVEKDALLHHEEFWWVAFPAIFLIAGGLFTYLLLSRIREEDP